MRAKKGSDFEREFCKLLSRWWTAGVEGSDRDDVFWRTSQSGGRATQRAKGGKATYGSQGDVAAVDPVGRPFLNFFTVELKRGNSHGSPVHLFDSPKTKAVRGWERALAQAMESAHQAGTEWLLVLRRDRCDPVACMATKVAKSLGLLGVLPSMRFRVHVNGVGEMRYVCLPLQKFMRKVHPHDIIRQADLKTRSHNKQKDK